MTLFLLRRRWLLPLALSVLGSGISCSAPAGFHADESASSAQHPVPFQGDAAKTAATATEQKQNPSGLPFRDSQSLPAGTLLTVRLNDSISAENPDATGTFKAVVDDPVVIEGSPLVPRGASVAGRVESARSSPMKRNRGYVRLTLDSIDLDGKDFALQTSSLFARGTASQTDAPGGVIRLEKGRRLTFRLAEPVYVASRQTVSGH